MDDETTGKLPPDDEELTRVTPPDADDATRVMPPADEDATRVMPAADETGATRVMPAGGATPPPPPTQPTLLMTHGRQPSEGGVPWWVWLLIVLAVIAAVAALWFFYLRPTSPETTAGEVFVGTWSPEAGTGGGLVIKQDGEQFKVTQYDSDLNAAGSTTATLEGEDLTLSVKASAIGLTDVTGTVKGTLTHDESGDTLTLQFAAGDLQLKPITYVRVDVLLPGTPSPSPTPTATPSPSPTTASPSPTVTTSPTTSPSPNVDQQVQDNIAKLQVGIVAWAADNNNLYPPPQDVVQGGGLAQYVSPWPTNPFTSQAMAPGTSPGSYVYEQLSGGQAYKLTGYLSNGLTYTVP
jgi:hypothetical protein